MTFNRSYVNTTLIGDCRETMQKMISENVQVHMVVTSPPYWGLRDYGISGQLGLEPTPDLYVANIVETFRLIWQVLRDDGTVWLNLGDSHMGSGGPGSQWDRSHSKNKGEFSKFDNPNRSADSMSLIKNGDLVGIPWAVATALRDDGWYLRSDLIWAKGVSGQKELTEQVAIACMAEGIDDDSTQRIIASLDPYVGNVMPDSAESRPNISHEYLFLLAKSGKPKFWSHRDGKPGTRRKPKPEYRWVHRFTCEERDTDPKDSKNWKRINLWKSRKYYFDHYAIREKALYPLGQNSPQSNKSPYDQGFTRDGHARQHKKERLIKQQKWADRHEKYKQQGHGRRHAGFNERWDQQTELEQQLGGRNRRSVWTIPPMAFKESHFATFPPALVEPCILAGTSEKGCCPECGAPWSQYVMTGTPNEAQKAACGADSLGEYRGKATKDYQSAGAQDASEVKSRVLAGMVDTITIGWAPTCDCGIEETVPCIVFDPFGGSGTTGEVAEKLGRDWILCELNPEYAEMAKRRTAQQGLKF